jgi:hypothetical protein
MVRSLIFLGKTVLKAGSVLSANFLNSDSVSKADSVENTVWQPKFLVLSRDI